MRFPWLALLILFQVHSYSAFSLETNYLGARDASVEMGLSEGLARSLISANYGYNIEFSKTILITQFSFSTYETTPNTCFTLGQQIAGLTYLWYLKGKDYLSNGMSVSDLIQETNQLANSACSVNIIGVDEILRISDEFDLVDKLTAITRSTFLARNGWDYNYKNSPDLDQCLLAGIQDAMVFLYSPGGIFQDQKMLDYRNDSHPGNEWIMSRGEYMSSKVRVRDQCKDQHFLLEPASNIRNIYIGL